MEKINQTDLESTFSNFYDNDNKSQESIIKLLKLLNWQGSSKLASAIKNINALTAQFYSESPTNEQFEKFQNLITLYREKPPILNLQELETDFENLKKSLECISSSQQLQQIDLNLSANDDAQQEGISMLGETLHLEEINIVIPAVQQGVSAHLLFFNIECALSNFYSYSQANSELVLKLALECFDSQEISNGFISNMSPEEGKNLLANLITFAGDINILAGQFYSETIPEEQLQEFNNLRTFYRTKPPILNLQELKTDFENLKKSLECISSGQKSISKPDYTVEEESKEDGIESVKQPAIGLDNAEKLRREEAVDLETNIETNKNNGLPPFVIVEKPTIEGKKKSKCGECCITF